MSGISRWCVFAVLLALPCAAQQFPAVTASPAGPATDDSREPPPPAANLLVTSGPGRSTNNSFWPLPYLYGGLALSNGASYSPAAGTIGGGLNLESAHFIALAETSFQNAHKQDSGTGNEVDLKGRAFFRTSPGWYFGGGAQWSKLSTVEYDKQAWRPVFGGGKDLFRENFSLRAQALYVLPGTDRLNALQGPEISLWLPSPAARSHFFYRQTLGIYEFHQTSVPGNLGTSNRYAATFLQFTAMGRF
jgi:hypothetical protein